MNFASLATWKNFRYISGEKLFEDPDFKIAHLHIPEEIIILGNEVELMRTIKEVFPGQASYNPWDDIDSRIDEELLSGENMIDEEEILEICDANVEEMSIDDYMEIFGDDYTYIYYNDFSVSSTKFTVNGVDADEFNDQSLDEAIDSLYSSNYNPGKIGRGGKVQRFTRNTRWFKGELVTVDIPAMQKKKQTIIIKKFGKKDHPEDTFVKRDNRKLYRKNSFELTSEANDFFNRELETESTRRNHFSLMAEVDEIFDETNDLYIKRMTEFYKDIIETKEILWMFDSLSEFKNAA